MRTLRILDELPSGYFVEESPRGILAIAADAARGLHEVGFGPEHDGECRTSDLAGRRPLRELVVGEERYVVRTYHHGGLLRGITNDRYGDPERPFRELILSDALLRSGVRTPRVVAARARMAPLMGWRLDLVTRRIEGSLDLGEALELIRAGELSNAQRFALFRAAGALVRDLHRLGFCHADLQPRNVLVQREDLSNGQIELTVLDLDGSEFVNELRDSARHRNLTRLYRAVRRRERRGRAFLTRADFMRFLTGYRTEREVLRGDWRAVDASHRRQGLVHGLGWKLERLFGSGPEQRDGGATVRT